MPVTPQITLQGKLKDLSGGAEVGAQLIVTLCGYGALVARIAGTALVAPVRPQGFLTDAAGQYSFALWGNDVIVPAGTYYTVTLVDDRGTVIQTAAYQFSGTAVIDLSSQAQYQPPASPTAPTVPLVNGLLVTVAYSANPVFPCGSAGVTTFEIVLTGDVVGSTLNPGAVPGAIYIFIVVQDGAGGHSFAWPGECIDAPAISAAANGITIQAFVARANGLLYPIAPGIVV